MELRLIELPITVTQMHVSHGCLLLVFEGGLMRKYVAKLEDYPDCSAAAELVEIESDHWDALQAGFLTEEQANDAHQVLLQKLEHERMQEALYEAWRNNMQWPEFFSRPKKLPVAVIELIVKSKAQYPVTIVYRDVQFIISAEDAQ